MKYRQNSGENVHVDVQFSNSTPVKAMNAVAFLVHGGILQRSFLFCVNVSLCVPLSPLQTLSSQRLTYSFNWEPIFNY